MPGTIGEPRWLRNLRERLMPPRANCLIRSRRELFLILLPFLLYSRFHALRRCDSFIVLFSA